MAKTGSVERTTDSAIAELRRLRDMADAVLRDQVQPGLTHASRRADAALHTAGATLRDQGEVASGHVREQPLVAMLVATALGFLIGRFIR
jgi:ElaB/YqjD/DUF883 family membrane-anchored ribosome-binding protein